ncbi:NADP-dependent oxidoreductase [Paremcibacter congregatus]|uniref:NADP-dependent oxidoreductase n=1 Tax=Paremcibacter congregatus TaxID=2043170 RepID=UPI003A91B28B
MTQINQQIVLKSRPEGWVTPDNFELVEGRIPEIGAGEFLVRNLYLSVDPYMRSRMNDAKSYVPPFQIGAVLEAGVVGEVVASQNDKFREGDVVVGMFGWENYSKSTGQDVMVVERGAVPLSYYLGVLGMPGMTAYAGLVGVANLQPGETVFVSAASGAVGSVVGQLAKIMGCTVVGCAGSDDKVTYLVNELGFDRAFNYKTCGNIAKTIAEMCPKGIDVNFENVGGEIMEAALWNMRNFGRIALCGMIANYNDKEMTPGPRGLGIMIQRRLKMQGFIVFDNPALNMEFVGKAAQWLKEGKLKYRETVTEGLENAPAAFIGLLKGENFGKQIVKIAD